MYGLGVNVNGQGGINQNPPLPSAQNVSAPNQIRTHEGKVAKALVSGLDKMSFDSITFTQLLISEGGPMLRRRILNLAIGIIKEFANHWDHGTHNDEVARDAKRLKDTLDQFNM